MPIKGVRKIAGKRGTMRQNSKRERKRGENALIINEGGRNLSSLK